MNFQSIEEISFVGLFLSSFLAATFLPFSSEAVFSVMVFHKYEIGYLVIIAGVGNTLGGMFNYYIGYFGKLEWSEKYLKISHYQVIKWQKYFQKYGVLLAFFCWLPIVGDPLSLSLGYFKTSWKKVLFFMALGKFVRYAILAYIVRAQFI